MPFSGAVTDVDVADNYIYVGAEATGFVILDATNPAAPVETGRIALGGIKRVRVDAQIATDGRRLAYLASAATLRIVDVSNANRPRLIASFAGGDSIDSAAAARPYLYVGNFDGLRTLKLTEPPFPAVATGRLNRSGRIDYVAADEGRIYTGLTGGTVTVTDMRGRIPQKLGAFPPLVGETVAAAHHGFLYLRSQAGSAGWIDARDPAQPVYGERFSGSIRSLTALPWRDRSFLVVGQTSEWYPPDSQWSGMTLFDITTGAPAKIGAYSASGFRMPYGVAPMIAGNALYVSFDVTLASDLTALDPFAIKQVVMDWGRPASDGTLLYLAREDVWEVYDVTDIFAPVMLARYRSPWKVDDLVFTDGYVWARSEADQLHALDLSDLAQPREVARITMPLTAVGIAYDGPRVYLAGSAQGLWAYEYTSEVVWLPAILR